MSATPTNEPIRLDHVLGVDVVEGPGLVDIRGRIIRDGVVEAELEGRVERGATDKPSDAHPRTDEVFAIVADCYWFESTMERFTRERPLPLSH